MDSAKFGGSVIRTVGVALVAIGGLASGSVAYGQAAVAETAQTLDRVDIVYGNDADNIAIDTQVSTRPWVSDDYQLAGTSFTQCQNTATRGLYCLDGNVVKRFPNPSGATVDVINLFDCGNPAFNFDRDNVCTALTADITGNIWVAGKKRSKFSLFKVIQTTTAPDAPASPSLWTRFTTPAGTFHAREFASGRPLLVDLAVIDGDVASSFPLGGGLGGVIAVEERREVTFFPDVPQGTPVTIGRGGVWALSRGELLQSATILQKYIPDPNGPLADPTDTTRNWVLITTSTGRLLSRELPWDPALTAPVINHTTQANIVTPAAAAASCVGAPSALYDIQSSVKSRSIYVTDRRGCRALALTTNIDSAGFDSETLEFSPSVVIASTNPDPSATPIQAALQSPPQAVSIAPGTALSMAKDCPAGKVCPLVGDGTDTDLTIPAASMTNVQLDAGTPDGLVVFQIQNIADCRYFNSLSLSSPPPAACRGGNVMFKADGTPVDYDSAGRILDPHKLFLNVVPLLPLEVTRVKTLPSRMLVSPRYKALSDTNTFDALFGIAQDGVRFRETFDANFDLGDLIPGRKIGCGGERLDDPLTPNIDESKFPLATIIDPIIGPTWDILVAISEDFTTVGGLSNISSLPNGGRQHTDMLVNTNGCTPQDPPAAGARWSMYAYGLKMAEDRDAPASVTGARYSDSILAKLTLSLFKDLGETIDTYACVNRDPGGTGAPISAAACSSLQADWFNTNDKLTKCVESSTEPLNSTEIRACNAFEVQYAPFKARVDGLAKSATASDPANRVGELKARLEVFRYVYDSQFKPSIPANDGFTDPL